VAITGLELWRADKGIEKRQLHQVPAGAYFSLAPAHVFTGTEVAHG
jgi:hypothetical protein